mmetsp:Transcript_15372/g.27090  ORF Transcript_15372/g.27090 Transcript_15372/m.27090 type:complete len:214 (-) Transcript_15372:234-875(-)
MVRHLHHKDRRAGDLALHLAVQTGDILSTGDLADTLASTTLTCLDHDRVADAIGTGKCVLRGGDIGLVIHRLRDAGLLVVDPQIISVPGNRRHTSRLGDNGGSDFISQGLHGLCGRADESHFVLQLGKTSRQGRVLTGVAPHRHHRINLQVLGDLADEVDVGIVVVIGTTRNVHHLVCHPDVLRICAHVFGCGHNHKLNHSFIPESFEGPSSD